MSHWSGDEAQARERLSALIDGELDGDSMGRTCALWQEHGGARATWHAWHLIGDVLRSEDLAACPAHDAAFLRSLRARLAHEPVVLAPPRASEPAAAAPALRSTPSRAARRHSWMTPAAVAAGFMVVAAALVVTRAPAPAPAAHEPVLARSSSDAAALRRVASQTAQSGPFAAGPQTFVANGRLIRDARLDQYLAAHQQFSGSSALGAPSGFLRSATAEAPAR